MSEGDITFKKNPIIHARLLDSDTADPLYGLDMSTWHALTKKGDNMDDASPDMDGGKQNG